MDGCAGFKIAFRRAARSMVYSQINGEYDLLYVDFTGSPDDAKLNVSYRSFFVFQLHADRYVVVILSEITLKALQMLCKLSHELAVSLFRQK